MKTAGCPVLLALIVVLAVLAVLLIAGAGGKSRPLIFVDKYSPGGEETERHARLYRLLDKVGGALRRHGVPYWAIGGTMLGAVRHGAIIPWDDDVDIAIWAADLARAQLAIAEDLGDRARWGRELRSYTVSEASRPDVVVDVFPVAVIDGSAQFANPHARAKWHKEYLTPGEFGGLRFVPFGPTAVPIVGRPCSYLDRVYPDWDTSGRIARHFQLAGGDPGSDSRTVVRFDFKASRRLCEGSCPETLEELIEANDSAAALPA